MNTNEFEKVQEMVAEGIGAAGLDEIALSDEESAAKARTFVPDEQ